MPTHEKDAIIQTNLNMPYIRTNDCLVHYQVNAVSQVLSLLHGSVATWLTAALKRTCRWWEISH
ncbi:uncharacterized protein METZ01_LOCUS110075 [marine metagenome]|uniref:Uncharacterized protein n=1 Tax=marine metagenome TaxID=408172 RepID=A0A381WY82_9ZZZZ